MATVQAQMLSGRYRTQHLLSLWSPLTSEYCQLSSSCATIPEDLTHILQFCEALQTTRQKMLQFSLTYCNNIPQIKPIVSKYCNPSHPQFCQFLLDCGNLSDVIILKQNYGAQIMDQLFHITRTFCYNLHKERMKLRGRWNPF